ncbi:MAG: Crp/Fnr family transcriptional regulator [bacterium]
MEKIEILKKYRFYTEANPGFQKELEQAASMAQLNAGDFYFLEGGTCTQIALLGKGSIRVYKQGESGRQITLYHVVSGETCILTASCLLSGMNYPASATAESDSTAVVFSAPTFRKWVAADEGIRQFVFETLAIRMANVMSLVEEIVFNRMDQRLAQYLQQRFANERRPLRIIQATHEQIASDLGTAREVISRLLKELERLGAIELTRGRISLGDNEILQRQSRPL